MYKKMSAARRGAFLKALGETSNITLSAERAKVSRSWVRLHRSTDAGFDAACRDALGEAKARLEVAAGDECPRHSSFPRYLDGVELVVRGTGGSGGGKRVQIGRARLNQWTPRLEQRFLAALSATCNVKAACAEVGMWPGSAYNHRRRSPAFAEAWDEAIETGYVRLETALIEAASNLFSEREFAPDIEIRSMTAQDAIHLLHMHKHAVRGIGKRPGLPERAANEAEVAAALEKRLKSFDAWLKRRKP